MKRITILKTKTKGRTNNMKTRYQNHMYASDDFIYSRTIYRYIEMIGRFNWIMIPIRFEEDDEERIRYENYYQRRFNQLLINNNEIKTKLKNGRRYIKTSEKKKARSLKRLRERRMNNNRNNNRMTRYRDLIKMSWKNLSDKEMFDRLTKAINEKYSKYQIDKLKERLKAEIIRREIKMNYKKQYVLKIPFEIESLPLIKTYIREMLKDIYPEYITKYIMSNMTISQVNTKRVSQIIMNTKGLDA